MTNSELNAMIAELRGEKWFYMHGDAAYCSRCNWCIGYPNDGDKIYNCESCNANEREGGKDYAGDMNAADDLMDEIPWCSLRVNSGIDDEVVVTFRKKAGGEEIIVAGSTKPRAICHAYIAMKNDEEGC